MHPTGSFHLVRIALAFALAAALTPLAASVAVGTHTPKPLGANGGAPYGYYEYLPASYSGGTGTYKMILFLHGLGEEGNGTTELSKVLVNGPPAMCEGNGSYTNNATLFNDNECIVISPQSPVWWNTNTINTFMTWLLAHYRVDTSRIYVTGLSMGGGGTWNYMDAYGKDVAAACVPCCGASTPGTGFDVPTWAFHSADDGTVAWTNTRAWVNACAAVIAGHSVTSADANFPGGNAGAPSGDETGHFTAAGGWTWTAGRNSAPTAGQNPTWTQFQTGNHWGGWVNAYNDNTMWTWLFAQARSSGGTTTSGSTTSGTTTSGTTTSGSTTSGTTGSGATTSGTTTSGSTTSGTATTGGTTTTSGTGSTSSGGTATAGSSGTPLYGPPGSGGSSTKCGLGSSLGALLGLSLIGRRRRA